MTFKNNANQLRTGFWSLYDTVFTTEIFKQILVLGFFIEEALHTNNFECVFQLT